MTAAVPRILEKARLRVLVADQTGRPVVYELVRKPPVEVASAVRAVVPPLPKRSWPSPTLVRPVPPYAIPSVEVPTMVPFASVVRSDEGIRKSVVEPMLFTLKSVEVAVPAEEEPMAKRVEGA